MRHVALNIESVQINTAALVAIREMAGMSQAEVARRSGLSQGHISELERGEKRARPATIKKLAVALAVPVPALVHACSEEACEEEVLA